MSRPKQAASSHRSQFSVAELFCGCGGFSRGFEMTGCFRVVFGNDVKQFALPTFELNHTRGEDVPFVLRQDIRTVSDREVLRQVESKGLANLDCLIGGPPCQGFSQMRRTEERRGSRIVRFGGYNKLDQDPRNDLVLRFLEIAAVLKPKTAVIENVPQFLSHHHEGKEGGIAEQVESIFEELGYHVSCGVLNAADLGALTFFTSDDPKRQTENIGVGMEMSSRRVCSTVANRRRRRVSFCCPHKNCFPSRMTARLCGRFKGQQ